MKYEDALKQIKGADSVGGQLIVNRGGHNVLVGKDVQGLLIFEDTEEAKGIARELGDKVYAESRMEAEDIEDRSPLSTHPTSATQRTADPLPYLRDDQQQPMADPGTLQDAQQPPDGADAKTAKPNTDRDDDDDKHHGKHHDVHVDDKVETRDKTKR